MNKNMACKVLDLPKNFTEEQLKKQYHINALRWHPDKNCSSKDATEKFQEIKAAYEYLSKHNDCYYDESANTYEYFVKAFVDFLIHSKFSIKILLELDDDQRHVISRYLRMCSQSPSVHNSYTEQINRLIMEIENILIKRAGDKKIFLLEPSIDDLFEQKLFKLNHNNEDFLVPLWHTDMTFIDVSDNELNVRCEPKLEQHIDINENNDILIFINYDIKKIINVDKIEIDIGKKSFLIPRDELYLKSSQTYTLDGCGIPRINEKEKSVDILLGDIIIHFRFY